VTGLYNNGMHNFILDEMELGTRVAMALDNEACGFGPLFDLSYELYMKEGQENERRAAERDS
jgi:hypothetical protein